jgi:hypothetical protein
VRCEFQPTSHRTCRPFRRAHATNQLSSSRPSMTCSEGRGFRSTFVVFQWLSCRHAPHPLISPLFVRSARPTYVTALRPVDQPSWPSFSQLLHDNPACVWFTRSKLGLPAFPAWLTDRRHWRGPDGVEA